MHMPDIHFLQLKNYPILLQLQLEEALLRADDRNWCIINQGSNARAIVMGISGKPDLLINADLMQLSPVPVIRRFSGGGTVIVDENTQFVTFICNSESVKVIPYPEQVMRWTAEIYRPLFQEQKHEFHLIENDYAIGNKKFGGNAQYIRKNRWLQHTSLLWDFSPQNMDYLLHPKYTPKYRQQRNHNDFLCRLKDYFPCQKQFTSELIKSIRENFVIKETGLEKAKDILNLPHRKATIID